MNKELIGFGITGMAFIGVGVFIGGFIVSKINMRDKTMQYGAVRQNSLKNNYYER